MGSEGREVKRESNTMRMWVRKGEGSEGRAWSSSFVYQLQVEIKSKIFRDVCRHIHSKINHGLETQYKVFRYIFLCLVLLSVGLPII